MARFPVILADCPWQFKNYSKKGEGRNPNQHYECRAPEWLCSLPVREIAEEDCCLFLWVTMPTLKDALMVMEMWGFTYKTCAFTWIKRNKCGTPFFGLGYWTRANAELVLLGTRGNPSRISAAVSQVIESIPGRHSEKPDAIYDRIEKLVSGPYVEIFARKAQRDGWIQIGNEITGNSPCLPRGPQL